jgi:ribosome-binding ATPase YchF (GTP1/OBG family)
MKIGLVGYKNSGKSLLFQWLTGVKPDLALAHASQSATAAIPEPRVEKLCEIYKPKKITYASIEIVDTPGLSRDQQGNPQRLAQLRETDALVLVVPAFDGSDADKEIKAFQDDAILADLEIVLNRLEKVIEQNKRPVPRAEHEKFEFEIETLKLLQAALENGTPLKDDELNVEQQRVVRGFRLLGAKPRMVVVNTADDETDLKKYEKFGGVAVSVGLETELETMPPNERQAFLDEMQLPSADKAKILQMLLDVSGRMLFLTAGEKEVRTWIVPKGGTALDAAAAIHTDMAKGFIRAEVMKAEDLIRLGSEREVKAANLVRREPKDYIVQDGDIFLFHFSG